MPSRWLVLLLLPLLACAPVRDDDPVDDPQPWGNTLASAFFTLVQYDDPYDQGRIALIDDEDWTCDDLGWGGSVPWYEFGYDEPIAWVDVQVILGHDAGEWERDFDSSFRWFGDGGNWSSDAAFFYGSYGTGGYDDEPVPGRDMEGRIGEDANQADDLLSIARLDDDEVRGEIESVNGEWIFQATHCGSIDGNGDDDDDEPPPPEDEPDEPDDDDDE
jgi:hypothetical protein